MERKLFIYIFLLLKLFSALGQSIPVGFPVIEEVIRRNQLINRDSAGTASMLTRPIYLKDTDTTVLEKFVAKKLETGKKWFSFSVLNPELATEFHSHHPYGWNNGSMVRTRGIQTLVKAGVYSRVGPLTLQFKPEFVYAPNPKYEGFPDDHFPIIWDRRYVWYNRHDLPEKFGVGDYSKLLMGQSSARLNYQAFSIGISTENLWWGPGKRNSLLMSNNARGFPHLTLNTRRPAKTPIGTFEGQFIAGRLESSGFEPPSPSFDPERGARSLAAKTDDWRYLNGITVTYQPKWIKGYYIGFTRAIQQYQQEARDRNDYFPIFIRFLKRRIANEEDRSGRDQLASFISRWVWEAGMAEIYMEYGRNDASWNLRDFLMSPEHSRAFIFGFSKLFPLSKTDQFVEVNAEWTQMQQSINYLVRVDAKSWYMHSRVRQGYTHRGEVLGAGIGPGSNLQFLGINWINGTNKVGIEFERLENNNDFFIFAYEDSKDFRRFWVDFGMAFTANWKFERWLIDGKMQFIRSLNYQWELHNRPNNTPYFINGRDVNNLFLRINAAYRF